MPSPGILLSAMAKIPDKSLCQLASSESVDPRCLVLMARMVRSASVARAGTWADRALIAANPATPDDLRADLRSDWAWPVVAAANAAVVR